MQGTQIFVYLIFAYRIIMEISNEDVWFEQLKRIFEYVRS